MWGHACLSLALCVASVRLGGVCLMPKQLIYSGEFMDSWGQPFGTEGCSFTLRDEPA